MLTQPSGTQQESLEGQAKAWMKQVYRKPGNVYLEAVHRLDKPVSGIVVFGKTSKALARLNHFMRTKQIRKVYWAWLEGIIPADEGTLEHMILHDDFHAKVVHVNHPEGKKALLHYKVLQRNEDRTLVEIELKTGRYHQIRLQFSAEGHPIWGDRKYGGKRPYRAEAIALHHRLLQFNHPVTQILMTIEAPLPIDFDAPLNNQRENNS